MQFNFLSYSAQWIFIPLIVVSGTKYPCRHGALIYTAAGLQVYIHVRIHTILATKTSVEIVLVDLGNKCFLCSMKEPVFILDTCWIVDLKVFLLYSILSIEIWVLDALNFDNSFVI